MFDQATFDSGSRRMANPWTMSFSVGLQLTVITTAILVPLLRIEPLPPVRLAEPRLAPPHVMLVNVPQVIRDMVESARLTMPSQLTVIRTISAPRTVPTNGPALIVDAPEDFLTARANPVPPIDATALSGRPIVAEPPKQEPKPPVAQAVPADRTYRVGGDVKSPLLKSAPPPAYPPLAKATRVQGTVRLNGIISRDGTVRSLELVSGHPLLVQAAVNAVKAWLYEPARLNGQPVDVILMIDVNFRLTQ